MKKNKDIVNSILIVIGVVLFLAVGYFAIPSNISTTSAFGIPTATSMAKTAMDAQTRTKSFEELRAHVIEEITAFASKGARSTDIYVGNYPAETVKEMQRQLAFSGYKNLTLSSPLSGTNDFLTVEW